MRIFIALFFLVSCQTLTPPNPLVRFFSGSIQIQTHQKKSSLKVEIYAKRYENVFRVDVLSPLGQVLMTYLWNNREYFLIFPFEKNYYKSSKSPFKDLAYGVSLIQNPTWLLQILNQNPTPPWVCSNTKSSPSKKKSRSIRQCRLDSMTVQWVGGKIFAQVQKKTQIFGLQLQSKNISMRKSQNVFDIQVPSHFKKLEKIKLKF